MIHLMDVCEMLQMTFALQFPLVDECSQADGPRRIVYIIHSVHLTHICVMSIFDVTNKDQQKTNKLRLLGTILTEAN